MVTSLSWWLTINNGYVNVTERFLNDFFPSINLIMRKEVFKYNTNKTLFKSLAIFGFPGSGKTTLANSIACIAKKTYGKEHVSARISEEGDIGQLLKFGLRDKMVNILFADNATLRKQDDESLANFFNLRGVYSRRFNKYNGYMLGIIAMHRFHGVPIELRTCLDGLIIRDITLNPYDKKILEGFIKDKDLIDLLGRSVEMRDVNPESRNFNIFVGKTYAGIINILPSETYNFKPAFSLEDILKQ